MAEADGTQIDRILASIRGLEPPPEAVVLDTAAGISPAVLHCGRTSHELLLVTTPEPAAITDAYGTLKALASEGSVPPIKLVINLADSLEEAYRTGNRLVAVARRFLDLEVEWLGWIPRDIAVQRAGRSQCAFLLDAPGCAASRGLRFLASKIATRVRSHRRNHGTVRT
jgi:flagellar biosynthesis protein FlhG